MADNVITIDFQNLAFKRGDHVEFYGVRIKDNDATCSIQQYVENHEGWVADWDPLANKFVIHTAAGEETLLKEEDIHLIPEPTPNTYSSHTPPAGSFYWILAMFLTLGAIAFIAEFFHG